MGKKNPVFERPNVIITGGAGFIGSHLTERLLENRNVICIDNFVSGIEDNIDEFLRHYNFEFIRHDITEPFDLADIQKYPILEKFKVRFQGIQEIYHLACPTSPAYYEKFPLPTILTSALGTKNVLDVAKKYSAKVVFTSSSAVYGSPLLDAPTKEDYWGYVDPMGPRSCYNEGKRFAESLCMNYRMAEKLDTKVVRVFNTYGPKMKLGDGRLIPDFVESALSNTPLTIYGTGSETGTFCYVSDCIEGLMKVMASREAGPVNIGNPEPLTIRALADHVIHLAQSTSSVQFADPLPYHQRQGVPDVDKARDALGWFPVVSLEDGLQRTIEAMRGRSHIQRLDTSTPQPSSQKS
ncbi:MAG: GDP-mannose 4,6-dehydratase [Candidatus Kerfeldbacteria bacterium]|nr:GDP-mannose 4,6-dehydratase [Candidatus Kerfeldbacteria bacterium]